MQKIYLVLVALAVTAWTAQATVDTTEELAAEHVSDLLADGPNPTTCQGTAPATLKCNTNGALGELNIHPALGHTRGANAAGTGGVSHGINLPLPSYTGTMESRLDHAQGNRVFRCNVSGGIFLGCNPGVGSFPPENSIFGHSCQSYALRTTTPGGVGTWSCRLTHGSAL